MLASLAMLKNETFLSNFHTIWWATGPLMDSPLGHTRLIISIFGKLFQFLMHLWLIPKDQSSYFTNAQCLKILQKSLILPKILIWIFALKIFHRISKNIFLRENETFLVQFQTLCKSFFFTIFRSFFHFWGQ